jgi:hypothetical protein
MVSEMFVIRAAFLSISLILVDGFIISKWTESDQASATNVLSTKDSISAVNGKLNVGRISSCLECILAIPALRALLRTKLSFDAISRIYVVACVALHIEQPDVCTGTANQYAVSICVFKHIFLLF